MDVHDWPPETRIYHSRKAVFTSLGAIFGYIFVAIGFATLWYGIDNPVGWFFFLLGFGILCWSLRNLSNRRVQIIVSDKGLWTARSKFYSWQQIQDLRVGNEGTGKYPEYVISFKHPDGKAWMRIGTLDHNWEELAWLLQGYIIRFEQQMILSN